MARKKVFRNSSNILTLKLIENTPVSFIIAGATGKCLFWFGLAVSPTIDHGRFTGLQDTTIKLFGYPVPTPSNA